MSDDKKEEEVKPNSFVSQVPPAELSVLAEQESVSTSTEVKQETINTSVLSAQEKIINGLSSTMSDYTLENMKKLAPSDTFDIEVSGHTKTFTRNKMKPNMIKQLREAERIYAEDVKKMENPDLKLDRDYQLLAFKASLYLGMTEKEFEECDVELLGTVIQATELRSQGFRQC